MFQFDERQVVIGGKKQTFSVLPHPGAVGIIAYEHGKVALIRQLRPAVDRHIVEIPAGVIEPDEDPVCAATRELAEETGLRAKVMTRLGGMYATPGYSAEYLHIYLATELTHGETNFDDGEHIDEVLWYTMVELETNIAKGVVEDGKTIVALHMLQQHMKKHDGSPLNNETY